MFWSSLFYQEGPFNSAQQLAGFTLEPLWVISLLTNVIMLAFLLLLTRYRSPLHTFRLLPQTAALITAVGTLLMSHPVMQTVQGAGLPAYVAGALLTGIGSAMIVVFWGEQFVELGSSATVSRAVPAQLIGGATYFLITTIPTEFAQAATALLPVASIVFFVLLKQHKAQHEGTAASAARQQGALLPKAGARPPLRLISVSLLFGVSFGIMKGLFTIDAGEVALLRDFLNILAIGTGSLALFTTVKIFRMDFDHLTYQVALPLMALGFIFLSLHYPLNIVGTALHQCGYQYFYLLFWAIWPVLARQSKNTGSWIVCWGMLSIQLGQFCGSLFSAGIKPLIGTELEMAQVACLAVFVIMFLALITLSNSSPDTGWGFLKPVEDEAYPSRFHQNCHLLARINGLSLRESEVLVFLAKGRNRAYISKALFVSEETIKTHTTNIYRKFSVHSQQEIIDAIERNSAP